MPSTKWNYFMENFFGDPYMMWHDGIDPKAVTYLEGEERKKAEEMLIQSLREGSKYAAMGLRELRSQRAVPVLKEVLKSAIGDLKVQVCIALNEIEETTTYVDGIIEVLLQSGVWSEQIEAAISLRRYNTPEVIRALFTAVSDPEYLVRNHASESLLALHGFTPDISSHEKIFAEIIPSVEDGVPEEECKRHYERAAKMLVDLFEFSPLIDNIK
ncbi:MAG: HEAT repeat domain-containing protein [Candidatus Thorarchaeota archaeon]|nr:HEAT repeat domain-containing protein [Candidatus Thorarchaeota archaeon]